MKPRRLTGMRAAREKNGITQLELALQLGVAQPSVSVWERGLAPIPKARTEAIAKILEVTPDQLTIEWDDLERKKTRRSRASA
jgi:transcriptional regulator with XRE-family HTH domain